MFEYLRRYLTILTAKLFEKDKMSHSQATIEIAIHACYSQPRVSSFVLREGEGIVFGAEQPGQYNINDIAVSGSHLRILFREGLVLAEDLESTNATFVDAVRIQPGSPCELHDGAFLRLARNTTMTIRSITIVGSTPHPRRVGTKTLQLPPSTSTEESSHDMPPFLISAELAEEISLYVDERFDVTHEQVPQPADPVDNALAQQVLSIRVEGAFSVYAGRTRLDGVSQREVIMDGHQFSDEFAALVSRYLGFDTIPPQRACFLLPKLASEIITWTANHNGTVSRPWGTLRLAEQGRLVAELSKSQELHFETPLEPVDDTLPFP